MRCLIVAAALVAVALADIDLKTSFNLTDANKDGVIQKIEFDTLYASFDDDGDSVLNATEFATHASSVMSPNDSVYIFYDMDANNDQDVDSTEVDHTFIAFDNDADQRITYKEYTNTMQGIIDELKVIKGLASKLDGMFAGADANNDSMLNQDELFSILDAADTNGDDDVTMEEFKTFWTAKTGEPVNRAEALFNRLDFTKSGVLRKNIEGILIRNMFDANKDKMITLTEYRYVMLWLMNEVMQSVSGRVQSLETRAKYYTLFDNVDVNDDGNLDYNELESVYLMGDVDMSGNLSAEEYIKQFTTPETTGKEPLFLFFLSDMNDDNVVDKSEMKIQHDLFDANGDGKVVLDEFQERELKLNHLLEESADAGNNFIDLIDAVDVDGDKILSYDEAFKVISSADKNGDGIDMSEFEMFFMSKIGVSKELSDGFFQAFDRDMNGMVGGDAEIKQVFSSFDYDKDGQLSKDEYLNAMLFIYAYNMKNSAAQKKKVFNVEEAFKGLDNNTDGFISVDEFSSFAGINITDFIRYNMMSGMDQTTALYSFFRLDSNEDNLISKSELVSAFHGIDMNDDDNVDLSEYSASINMTFTKLAEAKVTGEKLAVLFRKADSNMDKELTRVEMASIFVDADEDKDGLVSEDEFKKFWKLNTNEPDDRTDLFFGYLDEDSDGFFGDDNEKTNFFNSFDYEADGMVSFDEFLNSMLFLFARAIGELEMSVTL